MAAPMPGKDKVVRLEEQVRTLTLALHASMLELQVCPPHSYANQMFELVERCLCVRGPTLALHASMLELRVLPVLQPPRRCRVQGLGFRVSGHTSIDGFSVRGFIPGA